MTASDEQSEAIRGALQALVTNAPNMTPDVINQITQQILSASLPQRSIPSERNAQHEQRNVISSRFGRRQAEKSLARNMATKKRKNQVKLRPLNGFICFRC